MFFFFIEFGKINKKKEKRKRVRKKFFIKNDAKTPDKRIESERLIDTVNFQEFFSSIKKQEKFKLIAFCNL